MRPVAKSAMASPEPQGPQIDPVFFGMAAGRLYQEGRLFETNDAMDKPPVPTGRKADEMTPEQMQRQRRPAPPETIYDDSGKIVDFDTKGLKPK